ncbi:MAG TPA: hypothetical protein VL527_01550 [Dongiaceae bacterium]|nr:hypothetical protein [Dongiaceae bacterium]
MGYYRPLLRSFTGPVDEPAALRKSAKSDRIKPDQTTFMPATICGGQGIARPTQALARKSEITKRTQIFWSRFEIHGLAAMELASRNRAF